MIDAGAHLLTVLDSITSLTVHQAVVVTGSHGGLFAAATAAQQRVRAAVFNDAGVGKDDAGIAGLAYLDALGCSGGNRWSRQRQNRRRRG